jgi:hypothetical protein
MPGANEVTMVTAGVLGLLLLLLSLRVVAVRRTARVSLGDGGDPELLARIRAQGNFVEYVPLALLLLFLAEQAFGGGRFVMACAVLLVVARLAHPVGMALPAPNVWRAVGAGGTWIVLLLLSGALLGHVAGLWGGR